MMAVENKDDERCPTATFPISLPHRRMLFVTDDVSLSLHSSYHYFIDRLLNAAVFL